MRNIGGKKRAGQEDVDSDYLCADYSQRAVSRLGCGKSKVIKQTLEMRSEDTSPTPDPLKAACRDWPGCLGELVIKGPARLTVLAKPGSLLGTLASSAPGRKRQRRASISNIGIL
jgi:hypothetical protein